MKTKTKAFIYTSGSQLSSWKMTKEPFCNFLQTTLSRKIVVCLLCINNLKNSKNNICLFFFNFSENFHESETGLK